MQHRVLANLIAFFVLGGATAVHAQATKPASKPWERQVFFGEQHLHSSMSPDAFGMGTRNIPEDAYNFAKGVANKKLTTGEMVQKRTPYDWCALADHAEYLGILPMMLEKNNRS